MPQPALHILLGDAVLRHWRRCGNGPLDPREPAVRNAFLAGTLGPDYGLFPGGLALFSAVAHRGRTGLLTRSLLERARSPLEQAFAWGWLTHVLADVAIHPLVNQVAAAHAAAEDRTPMLHDHVRVEVGVDAWFGWRHSRLRRIRLRPVLERSDYRFVSDAFRSTHACDVTPSQLMAMQRGMLRFTRLAIFFATSVARDLCWDEGDERTAAPLHAAVVWHAALACSARGSSVHAYLNPLRPTAGLVEGVAAAIRRFTEDVDAHVGSGLSQLPDWDLETGRLADAQARVA